MGYVDVDGRALLAGLRGLGSMSVEEGNARARLSTLGTIAGATWAKQIDDILAGKLSVKSLIVDGALVFAIPGGSIATMFSVKARQSMLNARKQIMDLVIPSVQGIAFDKDLTLTEATNRIMSFLKGYGEELDGQIHIATGQAERSTFTGSIRIAVDATKEVARAAGAEVRDTLIDEILHGVVPWYVWLIGAAVGTAYVVRSFK